MRKTLVLASLLQFRMICFLPAFSSKRSPNICDKVLITVLTQHHAICFSSNRMSLLISTGCSQFLFISTELSDRYQAFKIILEDRRYSLMLQRDLTCYNGAVHAFLFIVHFFWPPSFLDPNQLRLALPLYFLHCEAHRVCITNVAIMFALVLLGNTQKNCQTVIPQHKSWVNCFAQTTFILSRPEIN